MNQIRYILSFLLIAGVASVQAQQPIVKINSPESSSAYSSSTECDVTAAAGAPIFQFGTTGNVLVTGTLSGNGCGGGGTGTPSFGFSPPAAALTINGTSTTSVAAGSVATLPLAYQAYNASSCSVGTPTTTGSCPAISVANAACTGTGTQLSCSPTGATVSIPAGIGTNQSCAYTATATCNPGAVTSSAVLTVTTGSSGTDSSCSNLATIHTSSGSAWSKVLTSSVTFGDNVTVKGVNVTDYLAVWTYPGTSVQWPGSSGLSTRPAASANQYFAEQFVAPSDTSLNPKWSWTGSGINSNFSLTISKCPGDFGQTGTQLTTGCKLNQANSSNGLTAYVSPSQLGIACTLTPGQTYYLNILPDANLPVSNVSTPNPVCNPTCTPWTVLN